MHEDPDAEPIESNYYADNAVYVDLFNMDIDLSSAKKAMESLGFTEEQRNVAECLMAASYRSEA